ncbi:uncharacterized protein DUF3576 [Hasllibacter halocynthiae]|uniref:Uncharacterized protein DUF3576 n=1 Tax=Hasllibacter halocynthiae TaxID=595589 RepID=A0A2T0X1F1_9RHOB|nr:DUF3576 domain-containing protein [Hasllibacter halocynthiae]PRY92783.1 uncharacterized protein DUF3576 [Hasllibacter halocynthiae]
MIRTAPRLALLGTIAFTLAACGGPFARATTERAPLAGDDDISRPGATSAENAQRSSVLDLFTNASDPNVTVEVNRYIWQAAQDVLSFLPIQAVDPFTGVISYGYGTPPGGGRAYRATVFVQDPALDARSLTVALASRAGPVAPETQRAVEDAILTRARQLRVAAGGL